MATKYQDIWNSVLSQAGTQNVDVIASVSEDGINHYLQQHFKLDNRIYHREIKKIFNTQNDLREFTVNLDVTSPIQIQFPPYKDQKISEQFVNRERWYQLDSQHDGPELEALKDGPNKIQVYCDEVNISLTWPRITGGGSWRFQLKTLKVFAEAFAILNSDQDGYYVTMIPTVVRVDVPNPSSLLKELRTETSRLPKSESKLLDECEDKFTDLFVIAFNVFATEQTPRLVRNIRVPVPVIKDEPMLPSLLNISQNCLTVGSGIDAAMTEKTYQAMFDKEMMRFKVSLEEDIQNAGGLVKMISKNDSMPKTLEELEVKSETEIEESFVKTKSYLNELAAKLVELGKAPDVKISSVSVVEGAYAFGINEYFFNNVVRAVIPKPKHDCTDWITIGLVRGRACYWARLFDPIVSINPDASLTGKISVDFGGAIEACHKKLLDCSWRWQCGSLAISVKGRPEITMKLVPSNGVRLEARRGGNIQADTNVPFPFNTIINAVTSILVRVVGAFVDIALALLSFFVLYPEIAIPQQITRIKLRGFNSFFYERPQVDGNGTPKNKFIGYSGGLVAER